MPEHKQPPNQYEAAFLKRRYQPYGDNRKLAHHLGLSVTALDARARELGIPKRRRWTRTEKQRLRERLEEDHSYQQIAVQLRRSVTAVRVQACRLGLAVRADDAWYRVPDQQRTPPGRLPLRPSSHESCRPGLPHRGNRPARLPAGERRGTCRQGRSAGPDHQHHGGPGPWGAAACGTGEGRGLGTSRPRGLPAGQPESSPGVSSPPGDCYSGQDLLCRDRFSPASVSAATSSRTVETSTP